MKKIYFLLLLTVVTTGFAMAQKPQSVLWEISGKGLKQKSYLLGTIHTVPKEIIDKFPILKQVIHKSSVGIFENVDGEGVGSVPQLAHEPPLDSVFSSADYAVVDSFFVKHGYGSIKDHNNDASLYGMIQVALVSKAAKKTDAQYTLDSYLQDPFRNAHKTCYGLDEAKLVDEQMKALAKSPQKQADYLVAIIKGDSQAPSIEKMVHMDLYTTYLKNYVYEDQNFSTRNKDYAAIMKVAFERNQLWLPKIEDHIAKQSCFIAVGFGHLQYKTGLIAMLQKQGYTLKPINYNDKL